MGSRWGATSGPLTCCSLSVVYNSNGVTAMELQRWSYSDGAIECTLLNVYPYGDKYYLVEGYLSKIQQLLDSL